jgi:ferrous iron transport protein B
MQTVATFIPPIAIIFFCLSFLEDSGYMARAAFIMDRYMRAIGLPGKAFIPMLVGFGCTVPAILATRTLDKKRDRLITILMNPFMSCGARLPVYTFFTTIFFVHNGNIVVFSLYLTGIILAVLSGLIFQKTILRAKPTDFVMELPPYHVPTWNGVLLHTGHRLKDFVLRAGKTILLIFILMSFLNAFKSDGTFSLESSSTSILSQAGKIFTPLFHPMGITDENWPASVGLITGVFNKESVVGTMQALYAVTEPENAVAEPVSAKWRAAFRSIPEGFHRIFVHKQTNNIQLPLQEAVHKQFGSAAAVFAYLLFVLLYSPCAAALAAMKKEIGSAWTVFAFAYMTILAWVVAVLFYQSSRLGYDFWPALGWIGICFAILAGGYLLLRYWGLARQKDKEL